MRRVAVIGGGVMGLAAAWRLTAAGADVTVFEAHALGHALGSSHGATRIFRTAYDHPMYVGMARAALPLWRELEQAPDSLVRVTGGVDLGEADALARCAEAMAAGGAEAVWLDPAQIIERFEWLAAASPGLYSPDAAVIDAAATLTALAARARASGATIVEGTRARVESDDGREVSIRAGERLDPFDACVLTAGAWIGGTSPIAFPATVTEEHTYYADSPATVPVIWRGDRFLYTVPSFVPGGPMKAGEHGVGLAVDPDDDRRGPDPAHATHLREWLTETIPGAGSLTGGESCLYTTTPDEHFVIARQGRVTVASPCSGHGFKFAPLIGEVLACLATEREPPIDVAPFSAGRF